MDQVKKLKIVILSDNFTSTIIPPLIGEWGFSAYIEADGTKILYDVGNPGLPLLHNAKLLGYVCFSDKIKRFQPLLNTLVNDN